MTALLDIQDLRKSFPRSRGLLGRTAEAVHAVDGVTLEIREGETLGVVGESGSGKSTLGRLALGLISADSGSVRFRGHEVVGTSERRLRRYRRDMQMVFQDPYASLDPTKSVGASVGEPMRVHENLARAQRESRVRELLGRVGLGGHHVNRYPAEMSGGQRQRVAIARAIALNPRLIVADEAVSALDVSTQSEVINLMAHLQRDMGLSYLFISHNLGVVRHISHRIAVMYLGQLVEQGSAQQVYGEPLHPYTAALLAAVPVPELKAQRHRQRLVLASDVPDPAHPPSGCRFHTRCPYAMGKCRTVAPPLLEVRPGTRVSCHLHTDGPQLDGATVRGLRAPMADETDSASDHVNGQRPAQTSAPKPPWS